MRANTQLMHMPMPILMVVGQGRCGMTAIMQALERGGVPCVGRWPAFEPPELAAPIAQGVLENARGKAIKVLSPQRSPELARMPRVVVAMQRNRRDQALSQITLLNAFWGGSLGASRRHLRALESSIRADDMATRRLLGAPDITVRFHELLARPLETMRAVAAAIVPYWHLDAERAAAAIHSRAAAPTGNINAELAMVAQSDRWSDL